MVPREGPGGAPALQPVRSLHYFLPVIDELRDLEARDEYLDYLRRKPQPASGTEPATV